MSRRVGLEVTRTARHNLTARTPRSPAAGLSGRRRRVRVHGGRDCATLGESVGMNRVWSPLGQALSPFGVGLRLGAIFRRLS